MLCRPAPGACYVAVTHYEHLGNPQFATLGLETSAGNLEGKEVRFGINASSLFAAPSMQRQLRTSAADQERTIMAGIFYS